MLIQAPDQHSPIYNPATLLWSVPSTWATKRFHAAQRIKHLSSVPFRNFFSQPLVNGTTLHFPTIRSLNSPLLSFLGGDDQLKCFKIVFLPSRKKVVMFDSSRIRVPKLVVCLGRSNQRGDDQYHRIPARNHGWPERHGTPAWNPMKPTVTYLDLWFFMMVFWIQKLTIHFEYKMNNLIFLSKWMGIENRPPCKMSFQKWCHDC